MELLIKIILLSVVICCVLGEEVMEESSIEARGKGKYAILTHLGFILAAKVGLYKIFLGIALVVASIKVMVLLAWVLAAFKYVPDLYPHYKHGNYQHQPYLDRFGPATPTILDALLMHFFYVAATKLFILKVIYGVIFYIILTKGWHLAIWFIHYLKEKQTPHEHIEFDHHDHYEPHHDHYEPHHDHYDPDHFDSFDHHGYYDRVQHLSQDIDPYSSYSPNYSKTNSYKFKKIYDSDGSYSVKNALRRG